MVVSQLNHLKVFFQNYWNTTTPSTFHLEIIEIITIDHALEEAFVTAEYINV